MYNKHVSISNINDLKEFVRLSSSVDGDVVVSKGRYVIDGKSIMGMLSIDTSTGIKVEFSGIEDEKFTEFKNFCESVS